MMKRNDLPGKKRERNDHVSIDIESLNIETGSNLQGRRENYDSSPVASIRKKFRELRPLHPECCIYRVPDKLRRNYEEAYTPRVVSIGPYHHKTTKSLIAMEDHKLRYVRNFLRYNKKKCLEDYVEATKGWEDKVRRCYNEQIDLELDAFTEMIFVDSIFIIQLFLLYRNSKWRNPTDRILNKPWMLNDVRRDMTLLENQLPFFVIEGLYNLAFGSHQKHTPSLLELAYGFFRPGMKLDEYPEMMHETDVQHFLDAIRLSYLPSVRKAPNENQEDIEFIPTATELVAAGVKLRRGKSKCLFDITFKNGILEIPCLHLYPTSESYFKNMIAFEQCYYRDDSYVIDYFNFFDNLVNTPGDAKLLIEKKIIENWLGNDDAAANLLNSYCKHAYLHTRNAYFFRLRQDLVAYCGRPSNKWKASLKRDYFTTPWAAISLFAAIILLILTIIQTVCSIIQTK